MESRQRDVLGIIGVGPALLCGDSPGGLTQRPITEQAARQSTSPFGDVEALVGFTASGNELGVEDGEYLRSQERSVLYIASAASPKGLQML